MRDITENNTDDLLETVIEANPQVVITSKGHKETTDLLSYVRRHPRFKQTDAYLNDRVYQVKAELICRPGPRAVQGLEALAKFIHNDK